MYLYQIMCNTDINMCNIERRENDVSLLIIAFFPKINKNYIQIMLIHCFLELGLCLYGKLV